MDLPAKQNMKPEVTSKPGTTVENKEAGSESKYKTWK
jgi:hypothetical protein